jgi:hypothetical protein
MPINRRESPVDDQDAASFAQLPAETSGIRIEGGGGFPHREEPSDARSILRTLNQIFDGAIENDDRVFDFGAPRQSDLPRS